MSLPRAIVFGEGCFGLFHAARGDETSNTCIVICPTLGYESVCSHRALRVLAEEAAAAGIAALRFDYHGTGDSAGHDRLPDRLDAWLTTIGAAIDAAKRESGKPRVILMGLRIGSNLAALAAATRDDVAGLIVLAPCASGRSYVRETRAFRLLAAAQEGYTPPTEGDELDAAGFILTAATIADMTRRITWPTARLADRVLVLERDDTAVDQKIINALATPGVPLEKLQLPGYGAMMVDPHASVAPRAINEKIVSWIHAAHPRDVSKKGVPLGQPNPSFKLCSESFVEEARWFGGESGRVFGIVTSHHSKEELVRGTIVLLNAGSVHHIGANRMHVAWARAWAALGFSVARIDVGGIGESPAAVGQRDNLTYSKTAVPDIETVKAELARSTDCGPMILVGLCSGAYAAYHTALANEVGARRSETRRASTDKLTAVVLINPQTFHFRSGDSLEVSSLSESRRYKSSLFEIGKWERLIRGKVDLRNAAKALVGVAAQGIKAEVGRRFGGADIGRELRSIVEHRIDVLMVYAAADPGLDYLNLHVGRALQELKKQPRFRMEIMENADHTFTLVDAQNRLQALLAAYIEKLAPRRIKKPTPPS